MAHLLPLLCLTLIAGQDELSKDKIRNLVEQLGSDSVEERERAFNTLGQADRKWIPALEAELGKATDPELKVRLKSIIDDLSPVELETFLSHVRRIAEANDRKKVERIDAGIRKWIGRLLRRVNAADGGLNLKLQPDLASLRQLVVAPTDGRLMERAFHVGKGGTYGILYDSAILVDGDVTVGIAERCLIVATGVVNVSVSRGNVIVGGEFAHTAINEGSLTGDKSQGPGSLVVSGYGISGNIVKGIVCAAPGFVLTGISEYVLLEPPSTKPHVNKPPKRTVPSPGIVIGGRKGDNPLAGKLEVIKAISGAQDGRALVRLPDGRKEYLVRVGGKLNDPEAKPLPGLDGWTVSFVIPQYVVFQKGKERASFWKKEKRYVPVPGR